MPAPSNSRTGTIWRLKFVGSAFTDHGNDGCPGPQASLRVKKIALQLNYAVTHKGS